MYDLSRQYNTINKQFKFKPNDIREININL